MARPTKIRTICAFPKTDCFSPNRSCCKGDVTLGLDEFETIRLIDNFGFSQEECAAQMQVARTTVQLIYESARKKLADALVNGKRIIISGGNYKLCENSSNCCARSCGHRNCNNGNCEKGKLNCCEKKNFKESFKMVIAVTYENGKVFQHFGHTETFKLYETDADKKITESAIGSGHGALAGFLKDYNVNALICGGIGAGARTALGQAGIEIFPGVVGDADESVNAFLNGDLKYNPATMCNHHNHDHGHHCAEDKHGCSGSCH